MATIRKRISGGKTRWYVEVRIAGKPARGKTFDTKPQAQSWALSTEQEVGKHGGVVSGRTFGDAAERYEREISSVKRSRNFDRIHVKKLLRHEISHVMLENMTADNLSDWMKDMAATLSPASVNREYTLICGILKAARINWKWMSHNPTTDVQRPKPTLPRDRRISDDEIKRILGGLQYDEGSPVTTMRQQIAVAFLLAIETAMRQGEIWGLDWKRVNIASRFVTLDETKNGTRRNVALSKRAVELLEKMRPEKEGKVFTACSQTVLEVTFRRTVKLLGIAGLHFHDSRHEAITRLARKLDVLDLARMVGHKDLRSLQIYYNPTASEIAKRLD